MNQTNKSTPALGALLLVTLLTLGGCAGMTQQEKGTATGAVVGGVVGNVLCGGVLCTGAGATPARKGSAKNHQLDVG